MEGIDVGARDGPKVGKAVDGEEDGIIVDEKEGFHVGEWLMDDARLGFKLRIKLGFKDGTSVDLTVGVTVVITVGCTVE